MAKITLEFIPGKPLEFIYTEGQCYSARQTSKWKIESLEKHIQSVKELHIRDDDIYLATYPKSGTHWVWEILMMLRKDTCEYETDTKISAFLDFRSSDVIDNVLSPRVLNCHFPVKLTRKQIFTKGIKIIHVQRNPKDVAVSKFHHIKTFLPGIETFADYLPFHLGKYGISSPCSWASYVKEWERFTHQNPDQILNLYYEDLKEDCVREIKKMDTFLGTGRDDDLIYKIADACHFHKLKKADEDIKRKEYFKPEPGMPQLNMYRKGEVGDWKNWFTVSQNEEMDEWIEDNLTNTQLKFRYSL